MTTRHCIPIMARDLRSSARYNRFPKYYILLLLWRVKYRVFVIVHGTASWWNLVSALRITSRRVGISRATPIVRRVPAAGHKHCFAMSRRPCDRRAYDVPASVCRFVVALHTRAALRRMCEVGDLTTWQLRGVR